MTTTAPHHSGKNPLKLLDPNLLPVGIYRILWCGGQGIQREEDRGGSEEEDREEDRDEEDPDEEDDASEGKWGISEVRGLPASDIRHYVVNREYTKMFPRISETGVAFNCQL